MGNPYLLTLLGGHYPSYDKAQKGQLGGVATEETYGWGTSLQKTGRYPECSASNANPNIGYPFLGINPGGCPIWGFPRCFRNFVNGSFPQLGLSIPLFLSLVFFIVVSILVMMSLCRILRSFIGYIVVGDIGAFPFTRVVSPLPIGTSSRCQYVTPTY